MKPMSSTSVGQQRARQFSWRPWKEILQLVASHWSNDNPDLTLPHHGASTTRSRVVMDMGCGTGDVTSLLQKELANCKAMGVDQDPEMLKWARQHYPTIPFRASSLTDPTCLTLDNLGMTEPCDLIWASFTVQYFLKDLPQLLQHWSTLLKPQGLLVLIETNGLFSIHQPQSQEATRAWQEMEDALRNRHGYDAQAGQKLAKIIKETSGFEILQEQTWQDPEFAFEGPAPPEILQAWEQRFHRMTFPLQYFGEARLQELQQEFLECLQNPHHKCSAGLTVMVAKKK